jgi:hypothetical protein
MAAPVDLTWGPPLVGEWNDGCPRHAMAAPCGWLRPAVCAMACPATFPFPSPSRLVLSNSRSPSPSPSPSPLLHLSQRPGCRLVLRSASAASAIHSFYTITLLH